MLAAAVWLALFEIRASARLLIDVDFVRALAFADDLVDRSRVSEVGVDRFGKGSAGPWLVDRVPAGLERGLWLRVLTEGRELVAPVALLTAVLAAPVAGPILVAICEVDVVG